MATLYVSNSAVNGYAVGSDSNDGSSKSTPKLTLTGAQSTASNGDTVVVNDGTYTEATYLSASKGLTWQAENTLEVTLKGDAAQSRALHLSGSLSAGQTVSFSGFVFDGEGKTYAISSSNITGGDVTHEFTDCVLKNSKLNGFIFDDANERGTLRLTRVKLEGACRYGYYANNMAQLADKSIEVEDLDLAFSSDETNTARAFWVESHATRAGDLNVDIDGVTGWVGLVGSNTQTRGIEINGAGNPLIKNVDIDVIAPAAGVPMVAVMVVANAAGAPTTDFSIQGISVDFAADAGYAIQVQDGTVAGYVTGGVIQDFSITGRYFATATPHGLAVGEDCENVRVMNGYIKDIYCAVRLSRTTSAEVAGVVAHNCYGDILYAKGTTGCTFGNNVVYNDENTPTMRGAALAVAAQDAVNTTGAEFVNNAVVAIGVSVPANGFVSVGTSQTATFEKNNYYSDMPLPANPWAFTASQYSSLGDWQSAHESDATDHDPGFNSATYALTADALIDSGAKWWTGVPPIGADGEPFPSWDISIGAIQSKTVPFHPTRL